MATYPEWNEALCAFLFNDENAGKTVYLHVPEETFFEDEVFRKLGGYSGFKADMLRELGGVPAELLIVADRKWQNDLRHLRQDGASVIPGHLALMLVLSGATEVVSDDVEAHAYYPLIPCFFGLNHHCFSLKEKELIPNLYSRISSWSLGSCEGKKGVFKPQQLGERPNVGLIQGQTIYRISDVEELHFQFHLAGFFPGDEYSSEVFESILENGKFSPRITKALSNDHLRQVAVLRAQEELESWDGKLSPIGQARLKTDASSIGRLLLHLCQESPLVRRCSIGIRLRDPREYFDSYTVIIPAGDRREPIKRVISPDSHNPGLTKMVIKPSEARSEGMVSFTTPFEISSEDRNLVFKYRPRRVRYFVKAESSGYARMSGWIEVPALTKGVPHVLMVESAFCEEFMRCNHGSLVGVSDYCESMDVSLTISFRFFKVERITDTLVDSHNSPVGTFAIFDRPKIRLIAGLKSTGRGNAYMRNAPPRLLKFSGLDSDCEIHGLGDFFELIGEGRTPETTTLDYQPKPGAVMPDVLNVSVLKHDLTLARCELRFEDYVSNVVPEPVVNAIGSIIDSFNHSDPYLPRQVVSSLPKAPSLMVVGRRPGEISDISRYAEIVEPCWIVDVRGLERTFHYIGQESLATPGDHLFKFRTIMSPAFIGPANKTAWVKVYFEGNVRCGTCANPLPYLVSSPSVSPIKQFLKQQRDFIKMSFPGI